MKLIKFFTTFALFAFVYSASAEELINGTILEHKSWVSGPHAISGHSEIAEPLENSASTRASTSNAYGKPYENIRSDGYHSCAIENRSSQSLIYTIDFKLCADSSSCFHDQFRVQLNQNGRYSTSSNTYLYCSFPRAGTYGLAAQTDITGPEFSHARGTATIQVR